MADLVGSLTVGRERFMREIEGLRRFRFAAIVIEARRDEVVMHSYRGAASPTAILGSLDAIMIRAGVHIVWADDRAGAAAFVEGAAEKLVSGLAKQLRPLLPEGVSLGLAAAPAAEKVLAESVG